MASTLQLNQRIVYAGLVRMSNDRGIVKSAFTHWNNNFSDAPLDIFEVVAELVDFLDLDVAEKKGLMIGLHGASAELYDDLKPVPAYILVETTGQQARDADQSTALEIESKPVAPHLQVTARYLQLVSLNLKRGDPQSHKEIVQEVAKSGLGSLSNEVSAWAADGLNIIIFVSGTTVQQCQELAHEFYVLICDFIGPVESDIIVNKVISELSSLDASREFNPQNLL